MELDTVGGYQLIARLGRGGMADVFLAVRTGPLGFSKLAVIKRVRADLIEESDGERYRRWLLDEARIAARLRHPNIVSTFEVGEHERQPFFAMEYLEGQPASQVLLRAQRLGREIPVELSLRAVADTLAALDYAHTLADYDGTPLALVHRDVSPQNVFWTYAGEIKLVDFGVAKFSLGQDQTQTGMLKGKLGYMAPEQARGDHIDARADLFAAGVVLWELVSGRRLIAAKSQAAKLHMLLFEPLPPLHVVKPDVDLRIAQICSRALERDPALRYPNAAAMRQDLETVLDDLDFAPRREDLAAFITPLFAADRAEINRQVRAAMSGSLDASLITLPRAELTTTYEQIEIVHVPTAAASAPKLEQASAPSRRLLVGMVAALAGIVSIAVTVVQLGGGGTSETARAATIAEAPLPAESAPLLRLCGSNTIGAELGPALVEAFLRKKGATGVSRRVGAQPSHSHIRAVLDGDHVLIELAASGTSTAFDGLTSATCDLGMASRAITANELAAAERAGLGDLRSRATEHVLALDGIAVIVHPNNPVRALDRDALRDIFTGKITNWSEVGGTPGPIRVMARDHHSGTFDTFKSLVLGKAELPAGTPRFEQSDVLSDTVAADPHAIGFVGLPYLRASKALAIGDRGATAMLPTPFTVTTEGYLLARRLYLYTPPKPRTPLATELVMFALSPAGQAVVRDTRYVSLDIVANDATACDARCPKRYASIVRAARRLSVDFRFRYGSNIVDSRATRDLDRVVDFLARRPGAQVMLLGFSDSRGDPMHNLMLSRQRAATIEGELASRGIHVAVVDGFGAAMPIAANITEADRERNRRVEIWLSE